MTELSASQPSLSGVLRLSDWGLIRASGPEARQFLHGQLTQDVQHLQSGRSRLAGYCSPKGRLLASFVLWPVGAEEVFLACSADLLPATLKRLSMFVLRARCKLSDASGEFEVWGCAGDAARGAGDDAGAVVEGDAGWSVRLTDAPVDGVAVPRALCVRRAGANPPAAAPLDADGWRALEALSGVPRIVAATADQFVPQMVNLEAVGGVNFQKGCYPGQEVVARSQYRGTLKRRGHLLETTASAQPGQEIFHSADPAQPAGMVALAGALAAGRSCVLAELKLSAAEGGSLHLGAADGPLMSIVALPYALPAGAA